MVTFSRSSCWVIFDVQLQKFFCDELKCSDGRRSSNAREFYSRMSFITSELHRLQRYVRLFRFHNFYIYMLGHILLCVVWLLVDLKL